MNELGFSPRILSQQTAEYRAEINTQSENYSDGEMDKHGQSLQINPGMGDRTS